MENLNNLPTEILLEIITRLPADSILDSKLVCRSWRDLVCHHPSFYPMYLSHLNQSAESGKTALLVKSKNQELHYFEYDDETLNHSSRGFNLTLPFISECIIIGSINGLVCLYKDDGTPVICSPLTKEYVLLPKFERESGDSGDKYVYISTGFGYLPLTNEYKIVVLNTSDRQIDFIEVAVYTLGSGNGWRNVGRSEFPFRLCYDEPGVYANGALHWKENDENTRVLVFDLTEEKFRELLAPPPVQPDGIRLNYFIGELGGVLYYSVYYFRGGVRSEIWLLNVKKDIRAIKGQVEHESFGWSKAFTFPGKEPLAFTKSGRLLCCAYSSLNIYDATTSTSKMLVDFSSFSQIVSHKNTLVSVKELGEADIKVMESAGTEETKTRDL